MTLSTIGLVVTKRYDMEKNEKQQLAFGIFMITAWLSLILIPIVLS